MSATSWSLVRPSQEGIYNVTVRGRNMYQGWVESGNVYPLKMISDVRDLVIDDFRIISPPVRHLSLSVNILTKGALILQLDFFFTVYRSIPYCGHSRYQQCLTVFLFYYFSERVKGLQHPFWKHGGHNLLVLKLGWRISWKHFWWQGHVLNRWVHGCDFHGSSDLKSVPSQPHLPVSNR